MLSRSQEREKSDNNGRFLSADNIGRQKSVVWHEIGHFFVGRLSALANFLGRRRWIAAVWMVDSRYHSNNMQTTWVVITVVAINWVKWRVCYEINCYEVINSCPLYVTYRHPITVMNKIRERQKEQEIAAELGNRTIAFTNWMAGSLCFPISFENAYKMMFRPNMS